MKRVSSKKKTIIIENGHGEVLSCKEYDMGKEVVVDNDFVMVFNMGVIKSLSNNGWELLDHIMKVSNIANPIMINLEMKRYLCELRGREYTNNYFYHLLKELVDRGALMKDPEFKRYYINPYVIWKGRMETRKWFILNVLKKRDLALYKNKFAEFKSKEFD